MKPTRDQYTEQIRREYPHAHTTEAHRGLYITAADGEASAILIIAGGLGLDGKVIARGDGRTQLQVFGFARAERKPRLPFTYATAFVRGSERRTFTVSGWNRDEAYTASVRKLEELGEREGHGEGGWWFVGVERAKW